MRRRLLLLTLAPACALAALAATAAAASGALLVNESPSLPEGLYQRTRQAHPTAGSVVAVDPPEGARAYLTSLGMPASVKLLKRVAATEGQKVCRRDGVIELNGRVLRAKLKDRRGVALPRWTGCRTLQHDEIFVLGDSPESFDSRYFGPVRHGAVAGIYREIVTW